LTLLKFIAEFLILKIYFALESPHSRSHWLL